MVTQAKVNTLKILKKASKENDAPIWAKVADFVQKSRSNQKIVNLTRINQTTEDGNAVVITGKILGTGNISHKVSVSSFSISNAAAKKNHRIRWRSFKIFRNDRKISNRKRS